MTTMWKFKSGRFTVIARTEIDNDLDLSFDETGEVAEKLDSGEFEAFGTTVKVYLNGACIGEDSLWESIYADPAEFFVEHRSADPMNRNCSIMKAARGDNVCIGHYFPDMVRTAVGEARKWLADARLAA